MPYPTEPRDIHLAMKYGWLERYHTQQESLESIVRHAFGSLEQGYLVYYGILEAAAEADVVLREDGEIVPYPRSDDVLGLAKALFSEVLEADEAERCEVAERGKRTFGDIIETEFLNVEDRERALFARYGWPYTGRRHQQ
ncbi:hypothetical protein BH24DEI1_BH24DEI1_05650 [soil metagenome]